MQAQPSRSLRENLFRNLTTDSNNFLVHLFRTFLSSREDINQWLKTLGDNETMPENNQNSNSFFKEQLMNQIICKSFLH